MAPGPDQQPQQAVSAAPAARATQHRGWREDWEAVYYSQQHKAQLGLQFSRRVPLPQYQPGRPMTMHPSWHLHFTTWEVGWPLPINLL